MHEALLYEREDGHIRCSLCPRACRIAPSRRGFCGVREHRDGRLWALTYGKVSSIAVDPIEKKPVFHFRPGTRALSLGSIGCTMRCAHCQNWQISRATLESLPLIDLAPDMVAALAEEHACEGVAFTYNEPVIWYEYVLDVARACERAGLYTVMVTNGYITTAGLDGLGVSIDVWRVDVKAFDDETYRRLCGIRSMRPILEAAVRAKREHGMHVEVVTNVIPTINDDERALGGIAEWIASELGPGTPWHITRFFPYLEMQHLPPTPIATLRRAREIGIRAGLRFVYLGNVEEPGSEDTVCPQCGAVAIARDRYRITRRATVEGRCASCGADLGIVGV